MNAGLLERVKKWAAQTHETPSNVQPWSDLHVEGMQLFLVHQPDTTTAAAVVGNDWPPLEGQAAFKAALQHGVKDAATLAGLSLCLLEGEGQMVSNPQTDLKGAPPAEAALAHAPALQGRTLEYWYRGSRMNRSLRRTRLDACS